MSLQLKVYDNGDHTCLVWLPTDLKPIANCRGFAIRRVANGEQSYLHGFIGFSDADKLDPQNPWKFPLQRYLRWDYDVKPGDTVQYSVMPVVGPDQNHLSLANALATPLTPPMKITGQSTPHMAAYFNKGIVSAQWVSRALGSTPKQSAVAPLIGKPGTPLRNALSGLLRPQILSLLADAKAQKGKIYAALYELNDPELIPALEALGRDCNLILANGAFKSNTPPNNDENHAVRQKLKSDGKINVFDRIVPEGSFAHNKFVVFCDSAGKPERVLTGSTNWTITGLCTQANNGLIIDDPAVAADYLAAWNRLKTAGNAYPPELVQGNSTAQTLAVDGGKVTPWFVRTSAAQDLQFARNLINKAQDGILFLFFNPGAFEPDAAHWTLLQNILERHNPQGPNYNSNLYLRGVVNQDIPMLTKSAAADPTNAAPSPVTLYNGAVDPPQRLSQDVLVPHNIKDQFHNWEAELLGAGVHVHSKVIVLDPFGAHPVVMTGSHNLGFKASSHNDDNLAIIEGNAPLAAAYAINIIAIYQTYRWNSYVELHAKNPHVWHGLVDNDQWQASYLSGDNLAELEFWMGEKAAAAPQAVAAAAAGASAARATAAPPSPPRHAIHAVSAKSAPPAKKSAPKARESAPKAKKSVPKKAARPSAGKKKPRTKSR